MSNFNFNPHITQLKESSTLWINQKARKTREEGVDITHFGFGQSPFPVHESIVEELRKYAAEKDYLPTKGLLQLRQSISEYYKKIFDYDFDPERILVGPGSKEMIFQILFLLEGPVIVPAPSWVSYGPQVSLRGKHIIKAITKLENNYKLTASELSEVCKSLPSEQKILILNSPNNPTGAVYTDDEIKSLSEVCRKEKIIVISDEIYAMVDFSYNYKKGFQHFYPEGTIITAGLSKSHSAGGYRLGFIHIPKQMEEAIKGLSAMISETFSAVSAPIQYAAVKAYDVNNKELKDYIDKCTSIHKLAGEYLYKRFSAMDVISSKPQGAFYLFVDFFKFETQLSKLGISSGQELAHYLFDHVRIAVLPGDDFYYPLSSLTARVATVDYDGAEAIEKLQNNKLDDKFIENYCPKLKEGCDRLESFLKGL